MSVETDKSEYLPIADAAAELSTTETKVLMLLKTKALQGTLGEDGWLVTRESVQCFDKHGADPERELQCRTSCSSARCGCH